MKTAITILIASVVALLYAPQGDVVHVPKGTTVVNPDTGEATYSDGVMKGTIRGFRVVTLTASLTNSQKIPVVVETNNGGAVSGLAYTVDPVAAGTVVVGLAGSTGPGVTYFVPSANYVGEVVIEVTGLNATSTIIRGEITLDVMPGVATSLIVTTGIPVPK